MDERLTPAINASRTTDIALVRGDGANVHRHGRWYSLSLSYFGRHKGIRSVHFLPEDRALKLFEGMLLGDPGNPVPLEVSESFARADPYWGYTHLLPFDQISDSFAQEVEAKLLASPQAYLALLDRKAVGIGGGPTSDMQTITHHDAASKQAFLEEVTRMMEEQPRGPYLVFYSVED
jgi:hypothetical protein